MNFDDAMKIVESGGKVSRISWELPYVVRIHTFGWGVGNMRVIEWADEFARFQNVYVPTPSDKDATDWIGDIGED